MIKLLSIFLLLSIPSWSQNTIVYNNETINTLDADNHKIGVWKLYDLKRNITVSGQVANNEKFDEANYYIEGKLFLTQKQDSLLLFNDNGNEIKAKLSWKNRKDPIIKENGEPIDDETKKRFFQTAELPAMFYGGSKAIYEYLGNAMNQDLLKKQGGRVVVQFIIDKDGEIDKVTIFSSENHALDNEAIKLIKNMPRWQPAFQQGYFVRMQMKIPINFTRS